MHLTKIFHWNPRRERFRLLNLAIRCTQEALYLQRRNDYRYRYSLAEAHHYLEKRDAWKLNEGSETNESVSGSGSA